MQEFTEELLAELNERLGRLEAASTAHGKEFEAMRSEVLQLRGLRPAGDLAEHVGDPATVPEPTRDILPRAPASLPVIAVRASGDTDGNSYRSVENRIGSQVFNRVGIVTLLVAVALFLKLVVDRHWIHFNPASRVICGLLAGAAAIIWSERFRRRGFDAFSYSLKAIGTGTLYLSLWASFQLFHLLPASVALLAMVAVTIWNAWMALAQDSELLAAYALVGGFATPVLLGSGENHEVFLFCYLLAMDVSVLLLMVRKPWQRLLLGSLPATLVYFIGWYSKFFTTDQAGVTGLFVVLLAAPFMAMALFGKQREDVGEGVIAPLVAATFLALGLYSVLQDSGRHGWLPWVAVGLGGLYLLLTRLRRGGLAEAVHLAAAVVFLTIAIPLKAEGRWITVGWLAEGLALVWVAARLLAPEAQPRVRTLLRWLGCGALLMGVAGAFIDFSLFRTRSPETAFWNARFATELAAIAALGLSAWLAWGARGFGDQRRRAWVKTAAGLLIAFNCMTLIAVVREITLYFGSGPAGESGLSEAFTISAWLMLYAGLLLALGFWRQMAFVRWQGMVLLVLTIGKVFLYDTRNLSSVFRVLSFFVLGVLLMAVSFAYQKDWLKLKDSETATGSSEGRV